MKRQAKGEGSIFKTDTGYRGYVTVNGKRKYFTARNKTEASLKKRNLLNQRDTTGVVAGKVETLDQWLKHWIKINKERLAPQTTRGYQYIITHYIPSDLKKKRLDKIRVEDIEEAYTNFQDLSGTTRKHIHAVLHSALKTAQQRGYVQINPAALVASKPKNQVKNLQSFSEADIEAIQAVLLGHRLKLRWHLGLALALRPAEALALEWKHVDFDNEILHVNQQIQKVGKQTQVRENAKTRAGNRSIPLPKYILQMLHEHRQNQLLEYAQNPVDNWSPDGKPRAWIFTSLRRPGHPISHDGDITEWKKILTAAGLPSKSRYTARHTAASILIANGVDIAVVAEILGHTDSSFTLKTYVHSIAERKRDVALLLDKVQNKVQLQDFESQ